MPNNPISTRQLQNIIEGLIGPERVEVKITDPSRIKSVGELAKKNDISRQTVRRYKKWLEELLGVKL